MLATLSGMKIVLARKWLPEEGEQHLLHYTETIVLTRIIFSRWVRANGFMKYDCLTDDF
jgi:hypothetical protein